MSYELVKFLFENDKLNLFDGDPIPIICKNGNIEMLERVIENKKYKLSEKHLEVAIRENKLDIFKFLLRIEIEISSNLIQLIATSPVEYYFSIKPFLSPENKLELYKNAIYFRRPDIIKKFPLNNYHHYIGYRVREIEDNRDDLIDALFDSIDLPYSCKRACYKLVEDIICFALNNKKESLLIKILRKYDYYSTDLLLNCIEKNLTEVCKELVLFGKYNECKNPKYFQNSPLMCSLKRTVSQEIFDIFLDISLPNELLAREYFFNHLNAENIKKYDKNRIIKVFDKWKVWKISPNNMELCKKLTTSTGIVEFILPFECL